MKHDLTFEMASLAAFMGSLMGHMRSQAQEALELASHKSHSPRAAARRIFDWADTTHIMASIAYPCRSGELPSDVRRYVLLNAKCLREAIIADLVRIDETKDQMIYGQYEELCACLEDGVAALRALEIKLEEIED